MPAWPVCFFYIFVLLFKKYTHTHKKEDINKDMLFYRNFSLLIKVERYLDISCGKEFSVGTAKKNKIQIQSGLNLQKTMKYSDLYLEEWNSYLAQRSKK